MTEREKTDALLRRALGGVEAPGDALLRQVKASLRKEQDMKTNKNTKRMLTLALAAALVLALSVTAYAAYMASVEDYIVEPPEGLETAVGTWISWNGYRGTPEYEASVEWENWYVANADAMAAEAGNTLVESPYANYGDYTDWGRQELEAIAAKYGVRLHTALASGQTEDIYEVLGTEPFLPEDSGGSGYVYEDGSFKLEGVEGVAGDGWCTVFAGAKGAITFGSGGADLSGGYEEWQYETGGQAVDLVLAGGQGVMLLETPGAYIYADVENVPDKEALEAAADKIGFDILAERFDGSGHPETAENVDALDARNKKEWGTRTGYADWSGYMEPLSDDFLPRYTVAALPGNFADNLYIDLRQERATLLGITGVWDGVVGEYEQNGVTYQFIYDRITDADPSPEGYMDTIRNWVEGSSDCDVNGIPGVLALGDDGGNVYWYDAGADLLFHLNAQVSSPYAVGEIPDAEELLALARSVTQAE